ncbi:hypothetical protein OIO90_000069 [Microbotryomycetes sp. JL221]|nr:hypothetical protein OIO90_000069 [Microbotryomycetes sp. JL221]
MPPANRGNSDIKWKCPECDKTFSRKEYVTRHSRLAHKGDRPYACSGCSAAFARSDLLKRHEKACSMFKAVQISVSGNAAASTSTPSSSGSSSRRDSYAPKSQPPGNSPQPIPVHATHSQAMPINVSTGPESQPSPPFDIASSIPAPQFVLPVRSDSASTSASGSYPLSASAQTSLASSSTSSLPSLAMSTSPNGYSPASAFSSASGSPLTASAYQQQQHQLAPVFVSDPPVVSAQNFAQSVPTQGSGFSNAPRHETLAPGLGRSLSKDELLASEVLEDLMRSPPNFGFASPPAFMPSNGDHGSNDTLGSTSASTSSESSWSSSALLPTQSNFNQISSWDMYNGGDGGIENSPAAMMLADYFNKGNVGGISALDLGFKYEPTLYPDHLFAHNPVLHNEEDRKYYMPSGKFHIGYLMAWKIPEISTLSKYGKQAAEKFLPKVPVVHRGTLKMDSMPGHTAFALTVTGAAYSTDGEGFSNEMLVEKRVYLVKGFNKEGVPFEERFAILQSMLLYQLLGIMHPDEEQRILSQSFQGALVSMMRQLDLPRKIREAGLTTPSYSLAGQELENAWRRWVEVETWRRVCFLVFLTDLETATKFSTSPYLAFTDIATDLPSCETLWSANTAAEWLPRICSPLNPTRVSFLEALQALLDPKDPSPFDSRGILLAEIARLDTFPVCTLERSLSFLQMKTEQTLAQEDPVRTMTGGLNLFETRENEHRIMLRKIQKARERLSQMPGGTARGTGEGWIEQAMPSAAKAAAQQQPTPPGEDDNTRGTGGSEPDPTIDASWQAIQNMTREHMAHRDRASNDLLRSMPDFMVPQMEAMGDDGRNDIDLRATMLSLF